MEGKSQDEFAKSLLKKSKIRATPIRLDLVKHLHLYGSATPYTSIQKRFESADRITLYRTIQTLEQRGIIHRAYSDKSETYYALCDHQCTSTDHFHDHVHFQCNVCDTVSCEDVPGRISIKLPDFQIDKINIHLTGVCKSCR